MWPVITTRLETEGLLVVTSSHMHWKSGSIVEMVQDI